MSQILKARDDPEPVRIAIDTENSTAPFSVQASERCSWQAPGKAFGTEVLRKRVEPWLTALCQSEHISLLVGSGLTQAVHLLATGAAAPWPASGDFGVHGDVVSAEASDSARKTGRGRPNIEDELRAADDLLRGLKVMAHTSAEHAQSAAELEGVIEAVLAGVTGDILSAERALIGAESEKRELAFNYLVSFLMSFASRSGTRERLGLFTTNYDRLLEAGAEAAGLRLVDRFLGTLAPVFRSSRLDIDMHYNPPGIRGEPRYVEGVARFTKLHGSLDWIDFERDIRRLALPFGAEALAPFLEVQGATTGSSRQLMVYPNAAKDRETAAYPYVELFRDLAASICQPNHTLITYGYGFGDDHINRVVEDMLTIPSTHVVMISYDDPDNRIMSLYDKWGRHAQVSLLIGEHFGDLRCLVDSYLPKPAIDRTTFRMSELLKARWSTLRDSRSDDDGSNADTSQ